MPHDRGCRNILVARLVGPARSGTLGAAGQSSRTAAPPRSSISSGALHRFDNREAAVFWLNEDEYSLLDHLIEDSEVGLEVYPPTADDDVELVRLMMVRRGGASRRCSGPAGR